MGERPGMPNCLVDMVAEIVAERDQLRTALVRKINDYSSLWAECEGLREKLTEALEDLNLLNELPGLRAERDQLRAKVEALEAGNVKAAALDKFADVVSARNEDLATIQELRAENERLRSAILNQAGDNLCWLKEEDLGKIPTKAEFLQSCERYHAQIAAGRGELSGGRTIAQLEAECDQLRAVAQAAEDIAECGFTDIDPRVKYIEVQVSRREWAALQSAMESLKKCDTIAAANESKANVLP